MAKGKFWTGLKKFAKIAMIGGGSVLSLVCPPAGAGMVTVGMAMGGLAVKAGGSSADAVTNRIADTARKCGLSEPLPVITGKIQAQPAINMKSVLIIVGLLLGAFLLFGKKIKL